MVYFKEKGDELEMNTNYDYNSLFVNEDSQDGVEQLFIKTVKNIVDSNESNAEKYKHIVNLTIAFENRLYEMQIDIFS